MNLTAEPAPVPWVVAWPDQWIVAEAKTAFEAWRKSLCPVAFGSPLIRVEKVEIVSFGYRAADGTEWIQ